MAIDQTARTQVSEPSILQTADTREGRWSDLFRDFGASLRKGPVWFYSSWIEVLLSYRSNVLGPLWISAGTAVFIFAIGSLYGRVVVNDGINTYLAHLAVGVVVWYFLNRSLVQSCVVFLVNRSGILDGADTYPDLILRTISANMIYLMHNALVVVIVLLYVGLMPSTTALVLLFTLPLVVVNLIWMCVVFAILGARFPDFKEMISSVMRLLFFLTPILWVAHENIRGPLIEASLYANPFYYMIEVIRAPLISGVVPMFEVAVLITALPFGWLAASFLYAKTRSAIALWL